MSWDLLFDAPWWLPVMLGVIGIVIWVSGNRRRDSTLMSIGGGVVAVGIAVLAVSYFVETDKEKAESATRRLVQAVIANDPQTVREILHPQARLTVLGQATQYQDRDQIAQAVGLAHDRFGLTDATITSMQTEQNGPVITITFNVLTTQQATMARPLPSHWQFQFEERADGWGIAIITLVEVSQLGQSEAQRQLPRIP
jgi:hypothetical protein